MKYLPLAFVASLSVISFATVATSQTANRQGPPLAEMSSDLGVTQTALETCMPRREGRPGTRPSREEHQARLDTIASCLQSSGADVTAQSLDEVMQKYRPESRNNG